MCYQAFMEVADSKVFATPVPTQTIICSHFILIHDAFCFLIWNTIPDNEFSGSAVHDDQFLNK